MATPPSPVLDMLDAIGRPEHAGRVYRVRDPRAFVLEHALRELSGHARDRSRLALARAVEDQAPTLLAARHPDRSLRANVEFFTAVLLEAIRPGPQPVHPDLRGRPRDRWCGHVLEQRARGRLIRPASRYVGPTPEP